MIRSPHVAGQFYPGTPHQLKGVVDDFLALSGEPVDAICAVSPHAGYLYSGATAGKVLGGVNIPRKVILAGPNHRGAGSRAAVMGEGVWETPLGNVELDSELASALLKECSLLEEDYLAHQFEHSLEVQVPFLKRKQPDLLLTPICLSALDAVGLKELGRAMAGVIKAASEPVLMVASTDMSHYISAEDAKEKDGMAIRKMLGLDPEGLLETVLSNRISMCGVMPTVAMLWASLELGATSATLVEYTNSGAASGDYSQVVGYAGLIVN